MKYITEQPLLIRSTMLEEFLNDIVAKYINHENKCAGEDLFEDHGLLRHGCGFKFLLNEPRTMLITAELNKVTNKILKANGNMV